MGKLPVCLPYALALIEEQKAQIDLLSTPIYQNPKRYRTEPSPCDNTRFRVESRSKR